MIAISYKYHLFSPVNVDDPCSICLEPLSNGITIAHEKGGEKHPVHRRCMQVWARNEPTCAHCRANVDVDSLYAPQSLKEKAVGHFVNLASQTQFKTISNLSFFTMGLGSGLLGGPLVGCSVGAGVFMSYNYSGFNLPKEHEKLLGLHEDMTRTERREWIRGSSDSVLLELRKAELTREHCMHAQKMLLLGLMVGMGAHSYIYNEHQKI